MSEPVISNMEPQVQEGKGSRESGEQEPGKLPIDAAAVSTTTHILSADSHDKKTLTENKGIVTELETNLAKDESGTSPNDSVNSTTPPVLRDGEVLVADRNTAIASEIAAVVVPTINRIFCPEEVTGGVPREDGGQVAEEPDTEKRDINDNNLSDKAASAKKTTITTTSDSGSSREIVSTTTTGADSASAEVEDIVAIAGAGDESVRDKDNRLESAREEQPSTTTSDLVTVPEKAPVESENSDAVKVHTATSAENSIASSSSATVAPSEIPCEHSVQESTGDLGKLAKEREDARELAEQSQNFAVEQQPLKQEIPSDCDSVQTLDIKVAAATATGMSCDNLRRTSVSEFKGGGSDNIAKCPNEMANGSIDGAKPPPVAVPAVQQVDREQLVKDAADSEEVSVEKESTKDILSSSPVAKSTADDALVNSSNQDKTEKEVEAEEQTKEQVPIGVDKLHTVPTALPEQKQKQQQQLEKESTSIVHHQQEIESSKSDKEGVSSEVIASGSVIGELELEDNRRPPPPPPVMEHSQSHANPSDSTSDLFQVDPVIRSRSSAVTPPIKSASVPQRPKLLANLKPKSPQSVEDVEDEAEEEEEEATAGVMVGVSQTARVVDQVISEPDNIVVNRISSRPNTLPQRSSVVVAPGQVTNSSLHHLQGVVSCTSTASINSKPTPSIVAGDSSNTYINKRSSLYVNSPDFSKKSNLLSPVASSMPNASPFRAASTTTSIIEHVDLTLKSDRPGEYCRPPVVMHLKGGDQSQVGNLSSLMKMKTPDFSKLSQTPTTTTTELQPPPSSRSGANAAGPSTPSSIQQQYYKSPAVDPHNFQEIRKKFNYISDLQLKPPSEPAPPLVRNESIVGGGSAAASPASAATIPHDSHAATPPSAVSYPNLYVNTPEFTTQKFVGGQRQSDANRYPSNIRGINQQQQQQQSPQQQHNLISGGHEQQQKHQQLQSKERRQPEIFEPVVGRGQYPLYGSTVPQQTPPSLMQQQQQQQHKVAYPEQPRQLQSPAGHSNHQARHELSRTVEESFSGRVGQIKTEVPQSGHEMQSMRYSYYPEQASVRSSSYGSAQSHSRPPARYCESGAEANYQSGVIKTYSHDGAPSQLQQQQQQQRPTMPHHDLNASMIAAQQQQQQNSASVISLKQQQTDLLRTDLQRIQSPNQAASVGFMQMQMYPPTQSSSWTPPRPSNMVQGVNSSGAGFTQPLLLKSSPSPSLVPNQRMSASPTMMRPNVVSPAHSRPIVGPAVAAERDPSMDYYNTRPLVQQHMPSEKYNSTGDLSRPATSSQAMVRHSSADRYTKAYEREMNTVEVKQEPQRGPLESYNRQGEYGSNLPSKLEPRPPNVVPRAQIPVPPNNYPKFQQVQPSSSRGPQLPTNLMKAPAEVVNHSVQVVQSASTSSVLPGGPRIKRESPLDLSVKTVKTKADSTGGYYDGAFVGSSLGVSGGHVKPTSSLKVNYVPNFGQHNRQIIPNHTAHEPGHSRQNHTPIIAAPPPHQYPAAASAPSPGVAVNNSIPKPGYGPQEPIYQSTYGERSQATRMMQSPSTFSGPESVGRPPMGSVYPPNQQFGVSGPSYPQKHEQYSSVPSAEVNQRRPMPHHNQPHYIAPTGPGAPIPRPVDPSLHYKNVPPSGVCQIPLKQPLPQQPLQTHHNIQSPQSREVLSRPDQAIAVERKRHADFAHLSAGQQPPAKAIKVNDPYHHLPISTPPGHYEPYANKEMPPTAFAPSHQNLVARGPMYQHQYSGHEMPPRNDNKYGEPPLSYPNVHYHQPPIAVKKEQQMPMVSPVPNSNNYPRSDLGTVDQKSLMPVNRKPSFNRGPGHYHPLPPQEHCGSYPGDVKHRYPPVANIAGPHSKMGPASNHPSYPVSQVYYHTPGEPPSMPQASLMTPSYESLQYPKPEPPLEYLQPGYTAPNVSQQPQPQQLPHPPQFLDSRPLVVVPPKGSGGADRSVISKLKNAIEEKQHRLIQKQTSIEGVPSDDNKGDIASILAARIRTKGELKGYTGPPQANAEPKVELEAAAPLNINPKERFDPPADMEGVSSFDLMDWGSACNDFVEQLQTGKKKTKRRKLTKPGGVKLQGDVKLESSLPVDSGPADVLPLESLVPREAIEAAVSLGRKPEEVEKSVVVAQSDGSSDEDKPLVLIRQLSLEKAKVTESDANSRCSSLLLSGKTNERAGVTMKGLKVKRLLQEKRYADRIANATSSDSDTEKVKPPKPFKRKKNYVKQAKVNAVRKLIAARTGNSSKEESDGEDEKVQIVLPKKAKPRADKISSTVGGESLKRKSVNSLSNSSSSEEDPVKPVSSAKPNLSPTEVAVPKTKRKSKNAMAAKSLSDAENKAGCSKQSPTPTRTTKMRRTLSKDVGPPNSLKPKNGKDQKQKSKREEHMTRSKKKQEMVANSLVLRNDKVVRNVAKTTRNKPGPKPKVPVVTSSSSSEEEEEEDDEEEDESEGSSSSESDAETIISDRLRPRKARPNEPEPHVRGSSVGKKSGDTPGKGQAGGDNKTEAIETVTPPAVVGKRGAVKRSRTDNKEKALSREADEKLGESQLQDEKMSQAKKGRKSTGDPQKFSPGWEDQLYEFKRSLKVPASLITIESPKWHRVSTSLPDLEPRSNSEEDDLDASADVNSSSVAVDQSRVAKKTSSTLSSIIDLVHQRVIWPIKRLAQIGVPTDGGGEKKLSPLPQDKVNEHLLPTPVLVKSTRLRGKDNKEVEHVEEVIVRKVFQKKTVKKSRTRREYHEEKNKEIIREIFGGEDRPASAPPGCATAEKKKKEEDPGILLCEKVNEYEAIVINNMTYEQKFEEYLGLYSTPEETGSVSSKSLQLAMSIDEAIKEDVMIFQRPMMQGEDPVHGGLVKRRLGRRGYTRRKGSSGFDYIRKKKRPIPVNMNGVGAVVHCEVLETVRRRTQITFVKDRSEQDISKEIKGWVLNKGVGESVLHKATRMNLLDVVAFCLIRLDMAPDQKDNAGYTPLHEASSRGHLDIARLLLQHGANPSETSPSGIRPLHDAVENGDTEIVRLLLSYGADPKLATYAGQTPLDLAEEEEEMEKFLVAHLGDLQGAGAERKAWRFEGAWKPYYDPDSGFNVMDGAPEVDHSEQKRINRRKRRNRRKGSGDEFAKVMANTRKSSALNMTVKKLSDELNGITSSSEITVDNVDRTAPTESVLSTLEPATSEANGNSDDGELFEFEECETALPPVYFLEDEGAEKWCMLTDLQNLLKFKSKETLLKQICPPDGKKEEFVREYKMNEFLQKATCLQLLCSGEKLNIRASKVSLIKYTETLKSLLGVHTVVMRL